MKAKLLNSLACYLDWALPDNPEFDFNTERLMYVQQWNSFLAEISSAKSMK